MLNFFVFISLFFINGGHNLLFGQLDSTNIPLFVIDTHGNSILDEPKITADLNIIYQGNSYNQEDDHGNIYSGKIGIEIRGKYSASLPQKPFGFETRDEAGNNLNIPLFHMPEENDWILLANYNDKTFLRNALSFELFRNMGHYAPRTQFCEVVINGQYKGIYILTEKIKQDKGRVDIASLTPDESDADDIKGGYIFKVDYYNENDSWQSSFSPSGYPNKNVHFVYHYPKPGQITENQKDYLRDFLFDFESTLYSASTPQRHRKLYDIMDVNSFIDYFIIGELSRNVDAYKKSSYFHKDKNGKLYAGPVWDFDWAWKNMNECYFGATDGSGWAYEVHKCNPWPVPPTWMNRLLEDPYFTKKLSARYAEMRARYLSEDYLFGYIDSVANVLSEAQERHYNRWRILGINVGTPEVDPQPTSYDGEIEKFKSWIATRLHWLDQQLPGFVVTDILAAEQPSPLEVYPNPAYHRLTIQSNKRIERYIIRSADGRELMADEIFSSSFTIHTNKLRAGLYVVHTQHEDATHETIKFVKVE